MPRICAGLAIAALVTTALATITGLLAPWWPAADLPNHFTPLVLVTAIAGLALLPFGGMRATHGRTRVALGLSLAGVAAINSVPLLSSLTTTAVAAAEQTDTLTVVSFNVFTKNRRLDEAGRWLLDQNADVIVLQEMTDGNRAPIKQVLQLGIPTFTTATATTSSCSRDGRGSLPAASLARPSSRRCRGLLLPTAMAARYA